MDYQTGLSLETGASLIDHGFDYKIVFHKLEVPKSAWHYFYYGIIIASNKRGYQVNIFAYFATKTYIVGIQ